MAPAATGTANAVMPESVNSATSTPSARPDSSRTLKSGPSREVQPPSVSRVAALSSSLIAPIPSSSDGRASRHAAEPAVALAKLADRLLEQLAPELRPAGIEENKFR